MPWENCRAILNHQLAHVLCGAGAWRRALHLPRQLKVNYVRLLILFLPDGYAMLMRPNNAETAAHGCHFPGNMAVRIRTLAIWTRKSNLLIFLGSLKGKFKLL